MSLIATAVKHLLAAGVTGDALVTAIAEMEASQPAPVDHVAEKRRAYDRDRKRAAKAASRSTGIPPETAETVENAEPAPSLNKSPQTPKINPNPGVCVGDAPTREARPFACPEGVDPQHWLDFLANRKRRGMANTATAYRAQLRELASLSDDEWPPGRLVQHAAEKGWGGIHDPRDTVNGNRNGQHRPANPAKQQAASPMLAALERRRAPEAGGRVPAGDRPAIANTG